MPHYVPKVLVVDDEPALSDNLARFLHIELGYRTFSATSGEQAIAEALSLQPDLIICDLAMPGIDGYGVLERIRAEKSLAGVPFVFLTGADALEHHQRGYMLGANEYLTKPVSLSVLSDVAYRLVKQPR